MASISYRQDCDLLRTLHLPGFCAAITVTFAWHTKSVYARISLNQPDVRQLRPSNRAPPWIMFSRRGDQASAQPTTTLYSATEQYGQRCADRRSNKTFKGWYGGFAFPVYADRTLASTLQKPESPIPPISRLSQCGRFHSKGSRPFRLAMGNNQDCHEFTNNLLVRVAYRQWLYALSCRLNPPTRNFI